MLILVINSGSSSVKYQLVDPESGDVLAKGLAERIGIDNGRVSYERKGKEKIYKNCDLKDHDDALKIILNVLVDPKLGAISSYDEISAVGHRIVHGGEEFIDNCLIDDKTVETLEKLIEFAPLHNPAAIQGINACRKILPETPMSIVMDTAFHQTMPDYNYIYPLPYEYYQKYKIRRYGAHGTSHRYVTLKYAKIVGKKPEDLNLITCHLGNGSSISAIKKGKVYDTSMGFTPLAGVCMGSRTGDLDPSVVTYIQGKEGQNSDEMNDLLNKKSGVLGISGVSSDFRDVEEAAASGNYRAKLALNIFAQTCRRFIGSYMVELGHVDAIIFTAGLGENSGPMRERILENLEEYGIVLDRQANDSKGEKHIAAKESKVDLYVVPTNEELMIARDTKDLL